MEKLLYDGPIVLAILDGVGLAPEGPGNAVSRARTPFLARAASEYLHLALDASGEAVGLTPGQMGNSEVGHNTMGAGKAVRQGIAQVDAAFRDGSIFEGEGWKGAINTVLGDRGGFDKNEEMMYNKKIGPANQATLHFAGILSDGGVHSDIRHLYKMIEKAYDAGVRRIRVHAVFDGRDVGPHTARKYVHDFEEFAKRFVGADIRIADGGGRMVYVADRYESDWGVVARGWDAMVNAQAEYYFKSVDEAFEILERIQPGCQDQYLPAFVIVDEQEQPVGKVSKGDAMIYFDFRADRAIEIAQAFTYWDFPYFDRGDYRPTDVFFAGMAEYNSDTHVPQYRLVEPVSFGKTLHDFLAERGVSQLAVSETVKFGHVTYYFDGNSYDKGAGEEHVCVESDTAPLETRPWMKSAEITDEVVRRMGDFRFVRMNYPGGDMVGHTADVEATRLAMEAIDLCLVRLAREVDSLGGALVIVADHGNAEELLDGQGEAKTSHTTNKVPFIIYDNTMNRVKYHVNANVKMPGLKNLAATIALMLGCEDWPEEWAEPLIEV